MTRTFRVLGVALIALLATSAFVASVAQAEFDIETKPIEIAGAQEGKLVFEVETSASMTKTKTECPVAEFEGELVPPSSALTVHPRFEGEGGMPCKAFGLNATFTTTGCDYVVHTGAELAADTFAATFDLVCSGANVFKIVASTCEVQIASQSGLGPATLLENEDGSVNLNAAVTGLKYTIVKDGIGCPMRQTGGTAAVPLALTDGTYAGNTKFEALIEGVKQNLEVN